MTRLMGTYLWEGESLGVEIMRCKGRYKGIESGKTSMFMLQGVGDVFELRAIDEEIKDDETQRMAKFLFVGRNIDANKMKSELLECCQNN